MNIVRASLAYFAIVLAVGFAFGAVRTLLVEPRIGATWAVSAEVPVMLIVSWYAASWLVRRHRATSIYARLRIGLQALLLLVAAETLLGLAFGQTLSEQTHAYWSVRGLWTLVGQLGFGVMPLLARTRPDRPG